MWCESLGGDIAGAVLLFAGLIWCIWEEDGDAFGLIPASVGLILLTIAKRRARTLALVNVKMDQGLPPPTRNALLEAGPEQLSPDVRELFERLSSRSKR